MGDFHTTSMCRFMVATQAALWPLATAPAATRHRRMHAFFETAKMLYVPAALLDYKFSLLHEKGELVNSMYIRKADFLKEDLHAYDNDISYGDI